jgi:MFS family permease
MLPVSSTPMATPCNENITARTTNVSAHGRIIVPTAATKRVAVSNNCLVGYLLGAFIGGFLFDIFDKQLLLTATLLVAAVATMSIPWALTLVVLAVMFSLQGVAMGVLDTGNMFLYYMCIFFIFIFYFLF